MKKPNSYGSVIKIGGKRRRPYAVRTSRIEECVFIQTPADKEDVNRLKSIGFRSRGNEMYVLKSETNDNKISKSLSEYKQTTRFIQIYKYLGYFEKASDANKFLADYNSGAPISEHRAIVAGKTFSDVFFLWKEYRQGLKNRISDSAWHNYELAYKHLSPLHERIFASLTTSDYQDVINMYNDRAESTVGTIRSLLKGMCKYAKMERLISDDPTEFLVFEWTKPEIEIHAPYTRDEIDYLWGNLGEVKNIDLLLILIYTGMRPTELLEIETRNIFLDEHYMIGGMKTAAGKNRIIPLHDRIYPLVKKRYDSENDYLVMTRSHQKYSYTVFYNHVHKPLMQKLPFDHRPHDGRHTFATLMNNAGANEVCTKLIMGHSMKSDITHGVYTHKSVDDLLAEINKIL